MKNIPKTMAKLKYLVELKQRDEKSMVTILENLIARIA